MDSMDFTVRDSKFGRDEKTTEASENLGSWSIFLVRANTKYEKRLYSLVIISLHFHAETTFLDAENLSTD